MAKDGNGPADLDRGNGGSDVGGDLAGGGSGGGAAADVGGLDPASAVEPRGPGRHKRNCGCERCAAKRSGGEPGGGNVGGKPDGGSPGSRGGSRPKSAKLDLDGLARQLAGAHKLAAIATKIPIFELQDKEAKEMAVAIQNVAQHYDISWINPATLAWGQLLMVTTSIYGPRLAMVAMMAKTAKNERLKAEAVARAAGGGNNHAPASGVIDTATADIWN